MRMKNWTMASASVFALVMTQPALAQASGDASSFGVEDIVVTAQKREQRLQDVPIAITAVSQDTLQVNRVVNVTDLSGLAPGLVARTNAGSQGSPQFSMRGVSAAASQPSQDRQISMYLDGVYIGGSRGAIFDLPDSDRIEVLRGPQGTLFGRNATAGAISVSTRDPDGKFGLRQDVTVGNYDQFRTRTTVDTPQIGPFSAYVTYVHDERRGDVRNLGAGVAFDRTNPYSDVGVTRSPKWLGSKNTESVFAALKLEASNDLTFVYKFDWSDTDGTPDARGTTIINPTDFVGGMLNSLIAAQPAGGGRYGPVVLNPDNKRPSAVNNAWSQPNWLKSQGHNLTINWQASDSINVKNITSYRKSRTYAAANIAGIDGIEFTPGAVGPYAQFAAIGFLSGQGVNVANPANAALVGGTIRAFAANFAPLVGGYFSPYNANNIGRGWQFSNELQANYSSHLMNLTVGALYYESNEVSSGLTGYAANYAFSVIPRNAAGNVVLPLGGILDVRSHNYSYAAYAQADIHITPQLDLQLGGRITKDRKDAYFAKDGTVENPTLVITDRFQKTKPTYSVGLNYKPTEDILIYAKHSTAFLSGGSVGQFAFAPESVKAYEIGAKTEFFDHRLRFNVALWKSDYSHSQASQSGAAIGQPAYNVVVIDNGTLRAKGVEAEATATPVRGLTLGGSVSYTSAKYLNPNRTLFMPGATRYEPTSNPAWTGNVYGQFETAPIADEATLLFRLDGNYQGKFRTISDPDIETNAVAKAFAPYEFAKARWIVNGRIALRNVSMGNAKGELAVWARNLFNNKDSLFPFPFSTTLYSTSWQPARTFGVDLIVRY